MNALNSQLGAAEHCLLMSQGWTVATVPSTAQVGSYRVPGSSEILFGVPLYLLPASLSTSISRVTSSRENLQPLSNPHSHGSSRISVVQHLLLQWKHKDVAQVKCLVPPRANGCFQISPLTSRSLPPYPYRGHNSVQLPLWLCKCQVRFV